ncbi:MAG: peptidoglycan-binding domain-containing protein [Candidatus Pacebacteria bacterium]|nr:peptidoglycan-binding domain-containing protein [Candidatus Paceibacterota bacterium]
MPKILKLFLIAITFISIPHFVLADELLQEKEFFVDPSYDLQGREKTVAFLQRITDQLYFYIDKDWWNSLNLDNQKEVNAALSDLTREFENTIYPTLTQNYGSEWKLGIDGDARITILVHPMIEKASGYFNPADEYLRAQVAKSNQREMVYLNAENITNSLNKSFLAHEFTHLITFNQKDKTYGISEDVWLNEARAEYAPTLVGYDSLYQGSYLQKRVTGFLENPQDSITEWQGKIQDYGALNLFTQYLVDHYGKQILIDSLKSNKTGISSIDYALGKNGFKDDFSQIFTNWTIAVFSNDCKLGSKYCYLNENLKTLKITPFIYYLPVTGESTLSVGYLTKEWTGNWQKVIGGKESLKLEFTGSADTIFKVPYIVENTNGKSVNFLQLNSSQKGTIYITDEKIISLTIIPSVQKKISDFGDKETPYQFFWSATTENSAGNSELIQQLQETIKQLEAQIASLQAQIAALLGQSVGCQSFNNDLYYGMTNNLEVRCLQQFLKDQGSDIYSGGLVTGNFLSLTQTAVIRFQEKYASEILNPLNLEKGTGYFGSLSRQKANTLLHK